MSAVGAASGLPLARAASGRRSLGKARFRIVAALMCLVGTGLANSLPNSEVFVISYPGTRISPADVKAVFTGEKRYAGATALVPIDNGSLHNSFLFTALKLDAARYHTIWTKRSFREGLSLPLLKPGDDEVIEFVRRTPGAVGYVGRPAAGVNVIHKY